MSRRDPSPEGFHELAPAHPEIEKLPRLPGELAYFDDFSNKRRTIPEPATSDTWIVRASGRQAKLRFDVFGPAAGSFVRHWAVWALSRGSPGALRTYHWGVSRVARSHGPSALVACLEMAPMDLKYLWYSRLLPAYKGQVELKGLKSLFHFAAAMSLGQLKPEHADLIGSFRLPTQDKFATLRTGEALISMQEESNLVDWLDDLTERTRRSTSGVTVEELRAGCVLICCYQYGVRPIQIARLRRFEVRVRPGPDSAHPSVYVTFWTAKKRWNAPIRPMTRMIHRDWAILFSEYTRRTAGLVLSARQEDAAERDALFTLGVGAIGGLITDTSATVLGRPRTATDFRHTAAQRLADAGASQEELAEFLGHSALDTSLVYFDTSPTQAARLNQALALSRVYTAIVEVARTNTIDKASLLRRPHDEQVQGCPHGIPLAGIGACTLGQSLCKKNPVLACYACRKFLPVSDGGIHRHVLESLRPVVQAFFDASKGELQSPAYAQLSRTLAAVEQVATAVAGTEATRD